MHQGNYVQFIARMGWDPRQEAVPGAAPSEKLLAFFRSEFLNEERSGFARLKRVPDSEVVASLGWYQSLSAADRASFVDFVAHYAHHKYGFLVGVPEIGLARHPFYSRWRDVNIRFPFRSNRNVMMLRNAVRQYKIDRHRGVASCVSEDLFRFAESVKSVNAPELRKRTRAVLNEFGFRKTDEYGGNRCMWEGQEFEVEVDFRSRAAQLRYGIIPSQFRNEAVDRLSFEVVLGMGVGWWDYIVEENVQDVFRLLEELIQYAASLPRRLREAASSLSVGV
jgi:hypothetical protein